MVTEAELTAHGERYKHVYHWETPEEVQIITAGQAGEQNFGSPPSQADRYIRIKEITVRNSGSVDTVIIHLWTATHRQSYCCRRHNLPQREWN